MLDDLLDCIASRKIGVIAKGTTPKGASLPYPTAYRPRGLAACEMARHCCVRMSVHARVPSDCDYLYYHYYYHYHYHYY